MDYCIAFLKQLWHGAAMSEHDYPAMRAAMVSGQLRTNAVTNYSVLKAMESVAREDFVPTDRQALAYVDVPIPLGGGRSLNAPLTTGRLLGEAKVRAGQTLLLIGGATGYAAALLVKMNVNVIVIEEDASLCAALTARFDHEDAVTIIAAPLAEGHPGAAPYDAIMIDGAVELVPQSLWDQLKEGGHLVAALVDRGITRLCTGRKSGGSGVMTPFLDVEAARLPGFALPDGFRF